uniref:Acyltransferase n=1 Tax=Alexandrium catenella TaxID=2925 RepID=A0A7S1SF87_ALECA
MSEQSPAAGKSFRKGLLAHLILVPAWVVSPVLLLGGLFTTGAPHGVFGVAASMGLGVGLMVASNFKQRLPLCVALCGIGASAPSGSKIYASAAAGIVTFLAWLCKGGKSDFARRPALLNFFNRYAKDYYAQCELRGKLSDVQKQKSCFGFHPHGVLSAGFTINGCYNPEFHRLAGKVNWLCDHNLRYKNPGFRWKCDAVKTEEHVIEAADKKTFLRLMANGENISLLPGGFQDAVAHVYGKECTVLKRRKGFIKYCLQYGYRVHPVYTFGESETYHAFSGLKRLRMKISEQNVPMAAFFGWPWIPFLPRPESRILTYVGPALVLPKIEEPTKEEVAHWHGEYMKALTAVFEQNKAEAGFPAASLDIC